MKQNSKKYLIIFLVIVLSAGIMLGAIACNNGGEETPPDNKGVKIKILDPLVDLSVNASDYAPNAVNYESSVKAAQAAKLAAKQEEEKESHNYIDTNGDGKLDTNYVEATGKYNWVVDGEDTTTFTKIFLFCDVNDLISRMAAAALPQDKMVALVAYITRTDPAGKDYIMTAGTGSAIRDYDELDELYDAYDKDDSDDNYRLLQRKRRKVMHEVFNIFVNDAAAASRTGIEILSYAQKVVADIMIPDYSEKTGKSAPSFKEFFKGELFDYDSLVYFFSFNESCGVASGEPLLSNVNYVIPAANKKEMTRLYGYYYQYQKKEFDLFNDTQYFDYLELGLKDYFDTDADALRYRDYDRTHYEGAYRYSDEFYKKYYESHFRFQRKQENYDISVYGVDKKWTTSYAVEMQLGCDAGMAATLRIGDVNWEYTSKDSNVTNYNKAAKEFYTIPKAEREAKENKTHRTSIAIVRLRIEQLKSQYYTINHKSLKKDDLANALKYQIYSFSGDYSRTLLANRKDDIYMTEELNRLDIADLQAIADKEDEIGRNEAMYANHDYFYLQKGNIAHQLNVAGQYNWTKISEGMDTTLKYNYDNYHQKHMSGIPSEVIDGVTVSYNEPVDVKFEDTLIKKKLVSDGGSTANTKKEYDTDWEISRLLDNHENVFRYAYGQIAVHYMEITDMSNYVLDGAYVSANAPSNIIDPNSNLFDGINIKAISTSDGGKFTTKASNISKYQDETYDSDDRIELGRYFNSKWNGILPTNGNVAGKPALYTFQKEETVGTGLIKYDYYMIFEGWYMDKNLTYKAKFDSNDQFGEKFNYDIRLYPAYKVIKTVAAK